MQYIIWIDKKFQNYILILKSFYVLSMNHHLFNSEQGFFVGGGGGGAGREGKG